MGRFITAGAGLVATLALLGAGPAVAKQHPKGGGGGGTGGGSATTGYDISYPQCGSPYPSSPAFGIVGVNGGLANDANSCFGSELQWALSSPGLTSPAQPKASLYVNTANPGPAPGVTDWPTSGATPYGDCTGGWTQACSYVYGEQRAAYSYGLVSRANASVAASAPWWLDIETANSWATSATSGYNQLNIAAIRGFIDGLEGAGATGAVGVYSTAYQWNQITGLGAQTSPSGMGSTLPDWVAGASTLSQAQGNCSSGGFTGAAPTLAQYAAGGFDADYRCS